MTMCRSSCPLLAETENMQAPKYFLHEHWLIVLILQTMINASF